MEDNNKKREDQLKQNPAASLSSLFTCGLFFLGTDMYVDCVAGALVRHKAEELKTILRN